MKNSRFTKPNYRMIAPDDVPFELLKANQRMKKRAKGNVCIVISARELHDVMVSHHGVEVLMGFIIVHMLWSHEGKPLRAAEIRAATMREDEEDAEDVGMQFVQDLQDFFDLYEDKTLEEVLTENFIEL